MNSEKGQAMRKPKPIRLTLEPWPDPKPGRLYRGRITEVSETKNAISVTLENLDKTMAGRLHHTELPASLHLGNKTNRFASAVGFDINTFGEQIDDLHDSVGCVVNMRFIPIGDGYEIEFEKVTPKAKAQTERTRTDSPKPSDGESVRDPESVSDSNDDFFSI